MDIIFYKNSSDFNVINKDITEQFTLTGTLKVGTDIISPVIWIDSDTTILSVNYCYIPELERYYFIDKITLVKNQIYSLYLSTDVLMTFKTEILASKAHVTIQADYDAYYADFETLDTNSYRKFNFDYEFPEQPTLVLITASGVRN